MGKHSALAGSAPFVMNLDAQPKPGSRRALRMAQRAARAQKTAALPNPGSVSAVRARVVLPENRNVYAEYMNENLLVSQIELHTPPRAPKLFSRSRTLVAAIVAATSGLSVAAMAATAENPSSGSPSAFGRNVSAPVVEKISYTVTADGKTRSLEGMSTLTVADALAAAKIRLDADDEVSLALDSRVKDGASIKVVRVSAQTKTEDYAEDYTVKEESDPTLAKGERRVVTKGVRGEGRRTVKIVLRDGREVSRQILAEAVSTPRTDEIVKVGTKETGALPAPVAAAADSAPVPAGSARDIARSMLASYGWGADQFAYLDRLWQRESHWNHTASNRSSGAYGIPQALPGSKMASAGSDWRTNPATQIRWGLGYIKGRYGSPAAAWAHSQSTGWY
ncbi:G5 domain-containing protein [Arcanobacterium sp. S3PF19]|uniref:aggregation-promoting factor C-terminal-like domain-containing protein n=1 Tax=Arcanobacterium sp. S3PF19 TaxID=1219585 RepID=UPI000A43EC5D|nr:G5 domain-containing protein [Arcanobacterium sp. S3PF19]